MPFYGAIAAAVAVVMFGLSARADFATGLAAYDAGDYATARMEWLALAEAGDPVAQTALADLHANGAGVPQNFAIAAQWFRRAADQGHMVAQLNLGDYYARGRGVPHDLSAAWLWLSLAARQGSEWAAARRNDIELKMTDAARREAARQLVDWRPLAH